MNVHYLLANVIGKCNTVISNYATWKEHLMTIIQAKHILCIHDIGYLSATEGMWKAKHIPSGIITDYYSTRLAAIDALFAALNS